MTTFIRACSIVGVAASLLGGCDADESDRACTPGTAEQCGGGDEDCDGLVDEPGAEGCTAMGLDPDGDGWGEPANTRCLCAAEPPWAPLHQTGPCAGVACDDGNPCTDDRCEPATGACAHAAREGSCEDLDPCTTDTICNAGVCGGGQLLDCNDDNPCTMDECLPNFGCNNMPLTGECDDGDRCTANDRCSEAGCVGTPDPHCGEPWCGDGTCNETETCDDCPADCSPIGVGACTAACDPAAQPTTCPSGVCVPTEGDPTTGICVVPRSRCDPVAQTGCAPQETCRIHGGPPIAGVAAFCAPAGDIPEQGSCAYDAYGCAPGLLCFGDTCARPCSLAEPDCRGGEACVIRGGQLDVLAGVGQCARTCGDERCGDSESCSTCPEDCGPCDNRCGDGFCLGTERCEDCPTDCGDCPECGDGTCQPSEDCERCATDCGACVCGDGRCSAPENCATCADDCPTCACGDGVCTAGEDCASCAPDCGACTCGDGTCDGPAEDCLSCAADCGACGRCGDGLCRGAESCLLCPSDCAPCGSVCGNAKCEAGEDESSCAIDCAPSTTCGNGACDDGETCLSCPLDCGAGGGFECGAACDPAAPECPANFVCAYTPDDPVVLAAVLLGGNGVCAAGCQRDDDCGDGWCLAVDGIGAAKICVDAPESCDPALELSCGPGAFCLTRTGEPTRGLCAPGCRAGLEAACGEANDVCHAGLAPRWRTGTCIGQSAPCDAVARTGCGAAETCRPLASYPGAAWAWTCTPAPGTAGLGAGCVERSELVGEQCQAGLVCAPEGVCRAPCRPGGGGCAFGVCEDLGERLGLPDNVYGVCR